MKIIDKKYFIYRFSYLVTLILLFFLHFWFLLRKNNLSGFLTFFPFFLFSAFSLFLLIYPITYLIFFFSVHFFLFFSLSFQFIMIKQEFDRNDGYKPER